MEKNGQIWKWVLPSILDPAVVAGFCPRFPGVSAVQPRHWIGSMFRGSASTKIDDRGRLKMPTEFRRLMDENWGKDLFLTSVHGDCALVYPLAVWEEHELKLASLPQTHVSKQRYLARVNYYGQQGSLDAQGRVVVSPILREATEMSGEVVVFGALNHLEVWNHTRFQQKLKEDPFTIDDLQSLSDLGI